MPTADWVEIERAPRIARILIQQPNLRPGSESISDLIRNIYERTYPNSTISNAGISHVKFLYEKLYAVPTTVRGVDMFEGEPVEAYPLRDGEILDPIASYAPGNPNKQFGDFKKMFGITSKPIATPVGGTRRRRRGKKTKRSRRRSSKRSRRR
jgi:hypothetical protein